MDQAKRQGLQKALTEALPKNLFIAVDTAKGGRMVLQPDFTCYENHLEGTTSDGEIVSLTYEDIAAVRVMHGL